MEFIERMNVVVTDKLKERWLQIRIDEEVKANAKITARLRGLSLSALVHSLLVKAIREEKDRDPLSFPQPKPQKTRMKVPLQGKVQ